MSEIVKILPWTPEWNAWMTYHGGGKESARMMECITAAVRARAQWLHRLLAEILSSDIPSDDVEIQEHPSGRTVVAIRGIQRHEAVFEAAWSAPAQWPPYSTPQPDRVTRTMPAAPDTISSLQRPSITEERYKAVEDRLTAHAERTEREKEQDARRAKTTAGAESALVKALKAVDANEYPDVSTCDDLDIIEVVDPNEEMEMERIGRGPPMLKRKINAPLRRRVVSLREDPVGRMAKRGQLGDRDERQVRVRASRYYEGLYARAEIGGARGIDPSKDFVDGGTFIMPDTDTRLAAQRLLCDLDAALGGVGVEIIRAVLIYKWTLLMFAESKGGGHWRQVAYHGDRFKAALDAIAKLAGFKPRPNRPVHHDDRHASAGELADNPELHRAIKRAASGIEGKRVVADVLDATD
jgi:hypothetical protein